MVVLDLKNFGLKETKMAQVSPLTIYGSNINVATVNNVQQLNLSTHDLTNQIAGNFNKVFNLNPLPLEQSLIIVLDGLILQPSTDEISGDYTYTNGQVTLLIDILEANSVLLAIYQEL